ncbi:MAG: hypothetical protein L6R40_002477 [Gallowayella cf. fulva]|nr:MAG: hypothetical protein L6R40_002477 [Xanthomendoza cf. fulva]
MSANAIPISQDRFTAAIADLPIGNFHAKAAELRNSIAHLVQSNEQLQPFANDGDLECVDAIKENEEVMGRMEVRIALLKREVETRGFPWGEDVQTIANGKLENQADHGQDHMDGVEHSAPETSTTYPPSGNQGGTLDDEELARRLDEQMEADVQGDDDGVHL